LTLALHLTIFLKMTTVKVVMQCAAWWRFVTSCRVLPGSGMSSVTSATAKGLWNVSRANLL